MIKIKIFSRKRKSDRANDELLSQIISNLFIRDIVIIVPEATGKSQITVKKNTSLLYCIYSHNSTFSDLNLSIAFKQVTHNDKI